MAALHPAKSLNMAVRQFYRYCGHSYLHQITQFKHFNASVFQNLYSFNGGSVVFLIVDYALNTGASNGFCAVFAGLEGAIKSGTNTILGRAIHDGVYFGVNFVLGGLHSYA